MWGVEVSFALELEREIHFARINPATKSQELSPLQQLVVFGVSPDPKPDDRLLILYPDSAIVVRDPR